MSTTTAARATAARPRRSRTSGAKPRTERPKSRREWSLWTCPNCTGQTSEPRKRCSDCGTFRY